MEKSKDEEKHEFTIFLLKEKYTSINNVVDIVPKDYTKELDGLDGKAKGFLYVNAGNEPSWVNSFDDIFHFSDGIKNKIYAFIAYIEVNNRLFIFTTSFGHSKISRDLVVNDFGLKVVLNEVDVKALRSIDARKLALSSHQKREVSSSNSSLYEFDFDNNEDFLNSISGKPLDNKFAAKLSGSSSLKIVRRFNVNNIRDLCDELLQSYRKKDYKGKGYDFIDNFKIVHDPDVTNDFEKQLIKSIHDRDSKRIVIAYPEIEDYEFCNYRINFGRQNKFLTDISTDHLFNFLNDAGAVIETKEDLEKIKIELLDEDGEIYEKPNVKKRYSLFDYLVFEFNFKGKKYFFINNQLYNVNKGYYEGVVEDLEKREMPKNGKLSVNLLPIKHKTQINKKGEKCIKFEDEGVYNKRVEESDKGNIKSLDKKFFNEKISNKRENIEICDLLTRGQEFICVKTYKNSSSVLSHLFIQGSVSAELFSVTEYKEAITEITKSDFKLKLENRQDIIFVFAIAHKRDGDLSDILPILSKISLRRTLLNIEKMGFKARFIKIDCEEQEAKTIEELQLKSKSKK